MLNILLTNDDGYTADGITILKKLLSKYGKVVIVAPMNVMSAKSVSLNLGHSIAMKKISDDCYVLDGTPADCVTFGLGNLDIKFDFVVSGINHGLNVSYDTMYSGTVGAGLQALTYRVPAFAVSCDFNFEIVEKYFDKLFAHLLDNKLISAEYMLNINFPLGDRVDEIVDTHIFYRTETAYFEMVDNNNIIAKRQLHDELCDDIGSDVYAVNHHNISVTKLGRTLDHGRKCNI